MSFVNGIWVEPVNTTPNNIIVEPMDINLSFIRTSDTNKQYKMVYAVSVMSNRYDFNSPYIASKIDKNSLRNSILAKVYEKDKEYIELENCTFRLATFKFNWKKWLDDALRGVNPQTHLSKFERVFTLKKPLPRMVMYGFNPYSNNFIINRFKEINSEAKFKTWFYGFIPKEYHQKINVKVSNMFDYQYDQTYNRIILKLKNVYIFGLLFAVGYSVKDFGKSDEPYIRTDFDKKVKNKVKEFDKKKWEDFIKKKFI